MVDFYKVQIHRQSIIEYFRNHPLLEWVSNQDKFNIHDPELILTKIRKQYRGIVFCFYSTRLDILIRPHYFFNDDLHNANDFTRRDNMKIISEFRDTFQVDLQDFPIVNLEYGINAISPIPTKDLITYLYCHDRNIFRDDVGLAYSRRSFKANSKGQANKYKVVKCYWKSIQQLEFAVENTFRFEINSKTSKFINELGVRTLADMLNPATYDSLSESIIQEFERVLILDRTADTFRLLKFDKELLESYLNPMRWNDILQEHRNSFAIHKNRYNTLLDKCGNHLKIRLNTIVQEKVYELTHDCCESANDADSAL